MGWGISHTLVINRSKQCKGFGKRAAQPNPIFLGVASPVRMKASPRSMPGTD